jgi:hypothetical protein
MPEISCKEYSRIVTDTSTAHSSLTENSTNTDLTTYRHSYVTQIAVRKSNATSILRLVALLKSVPRATVETNEHFISISTPDTESYIPKKDAVRELFSFCDERFVRPNILVDSGGGIHAYWTFTHEISTESWLEMAEALKHLCEVYGLAADPTVTADAARILRIPGTYNIKEDTPRQVRVIHATTKEFKPKRLRKILGTVKSKSLSKLGALAQEMDLDP